VSINEILTRRIVVVIQESVILLDQFFEGFLLEFVIVPYEVRNAGCGAKSLLRPRILTTNHVEKRIVNYF
jgi:hypothetical protein